MCTYKFIYIYIYMHAYVYIKLYVYIQLYAYNPLYIRNSVYAHVYIYIYICLFIYLYNMVYIHIYAQTQHWVYTTNPNPPARTTPSPASLPPPGDYLNRLLPGVGGTGAPAPFINYTYSLRAFLFVHGHCPSLPSLFKTHTIQHVQDLSRILLF